MKYKSTMIPILMLLLLIGSIVAGTDELYAQTEKIICPQCGKENDSEAKFCWNDGFNLSAVQKIQKPIKPAVIETSIPLILSQPEPVIQIEPSFENMSKAEMALSITRLTAQLEAANLRKERNPNYVGDLTQAEFTILLERTLQTQNIVRTRVITKKESGFGSFLKAIGVGTLVIFSLAILSAG